MGEMVTFHTADSISRPRQQSQGRETGSREMGVEGSRTYFIEWVQWFYIKENYHFPRFQWIEHFPGERGPNFFQVQMLIPVDAH